MMKMKNLKKMDKVQEPTIDLRAERLAEEFSNQLFRDNEITVRQANSVFLAVKRILLEKLTDKENYKLALLMFNKEWLWMQKLNNMKAVGKYIVITEITEQQKTESGILLTLDDSNQLRYKKGLIVIPGTDVSVVKKNDTVYYDKNAGHKMMLNDEVVTIITERDIVVVL